MLFLGGVEVKRNVQYMRELKSWSEFGSRKQDDLVVEQRGWCEEMLE